jgi:hypothetical protein
MKEVRSYQTWSSRKTTTHRRNGAVYHWRWPSHSVCCRKLQYSQSTHKTSNPTGALAFVLEARVLREDVQREWVISARIIMTSICNNKTHLSLMNSMASSRSLTGTTGRMGPNNSLNRASVLDRFLEDISLLAHQRVAAIHPFHNRRCNK